MYTFFIEKLCEKPPKYYIFTGFAPIVTFLALNRNIFVTIDNKYRYHHIKKKAVYFPKDLVIVLFFYRILWHVFIATTLIQHILVNINNTIRFYVI